MSAGPPFQVIWRRALLQSVKLTDNAKVVGVLMSEFMNAEGLTWLGVPETARKTGRCPSAVQKARQALKAAGFIVAVPPNEASRIEPWQKLPKDKKTAMFLLEIPAPRT